MKSRQNKLERDQHQGKWGSRYRRLNLHDKLTRRNWLENSTLAVHRLLVRIFF